MEILFGFLKRRTACRRNHSSHGKRIPFVPRIESLESRQPMAADVILEWNDVMLIANAADHSGAAEQGGPILTARAFAMVSGAMYDAYNSIERIGAPFLIRAKVNGKTDTDAAVAQAAHDTLVALFPSQTPRFDAALAETLARIPDGAAEDRGRALGSKVAQHCILDRLDDGVAEFPQFNAQYHPKLKPGFHDVDPLNPTQGFYAPGAMHVTPFVVEDLDQFEARRLDNGTPAGRMAFMNSAEYKAAYDEVYALGGDGITTPTSRTPEQTEIGIYWGYDGRPGLGTPPRLYNQIARTIAIQQKNSVADNARLFALINIAQADAGLSAWNNKYDDDFWRPILGIRGGESDENYATHGNATWTPLGAQVSNPRLGEKNFTPPFPAYTSGHATFGAAAFQTLERFYGRDNIKFTFVSDELNGITRGADGNTRPVVARTFDSFSEAKFENAQSRIYLGIHWGFDRDDGIKTGDATADFIFENSLQPKSSSGQALRHNTFDPIDVNDDGNCTALDALIVINTLNAGSSSAPEFVDVNADHFASALDALLVINFLNEQPTDPLVGEGEASIGELSIYLPWFIEEKSTGIDSLAEGVVSEEFIAADPNDWDSLSNVERSLKEVTVCNALSLAFDFEAHQEQQDPGKSRNLFILAGAAVFDNLPPT